MNMRMKREILSPGVQDAGEPNLSAEPFRIRGNLQHGGGTGAEQQAIEKSWVVQAEPIQFVRHSKDNVEVWNFEKIFFAGVYPALTRLRLALGAMPIPAGIIGNGLVIALRAAVDVPAERRGAAAANGSKHRQLLIAQPRTLCNEKITLLVKYVGHLHGRPVHSGFCNLRERGSSAGFGTMIRSSGLAVACKCRRDK